MPGKGILLMVIIMVSRVPLELQSVKPGFLRKCCMKNPVRNSVPPDLRIQHSGGIY